MMKEIDTSLSAIGQRISIMRQREGITQQELAEALAVRRENVSYWENGTRDIKSEALVLLARELHTSTDYLLGLSDVPSVDVDLKAVCDYTGLSEEAIRGLAELKEHEIKSINAMLADEHLRRAIYLMFDVANYLNEGVGNK